MINHIPPGQFMLILGGVHNGGWATTVQKNSNSHERVVIETKTTTRAKKMRKELLDQLDRSGKNFDFYKTLAESYVRHFETLQSLSEDIEARGAIVEITSGNGFTKTAPNESIQLAEKEELAMIKILDALQLKAPVVNDEPNESDYL